MGHLHKYFPWSLQNGIFSVCTEVVQRVFAKEGFLENWRPEGDFSGNRLLSLIHLKNYTLVERLHH